MAGEWSRTRARTARKQFGVRDKLVSGMFLVGVTFSLWVQPSGTYSWMWNEAKDTGHQFIVGLLDISESQFGEQWKVAQGGNQTIDLSKMIPGDARQLSATLKKGNSDLDFDYKIVAELKDEEEQGDAQKLEEVLRIKIEQGKDVLYDGLVRDLHPYTPGQKRTNNPTEDRLTPEDPDRTFLITVYLPEEGVDASYQALAAELMLRFLAKQATPNSIYAE
jgi:hypothetical protein